MSFFYIVHRVSQELDCILLKKQVLEVDNMSLRNKLQENEIALVTAREECSSYEKRSQDLEQKLLRSQNEAKALHSRMESFFKEVQVQLGNEPVTSLPKEEHVLERLREVCRKEKSSTEVMVTHRTKKVYYFLWFTGVALVYFYMTLVNSSIDMLILFAYTVCN